MDDAEKNLISYAVRVRLGVPANMRGCLYLEQAAALMLEEPDIPIMQIYSRIASGYGYNTLSVDHMIRYAVERAYVRNQLNHCFSRIEGRPTNSKAIRKVVALVREMQETGTTP